jgi:hypothetical protein
MSPNAASAHFEVLDRLPKGEPHDSMKFVKRRDLISARRPQGVLKPSTPPTRARAIGSEDAHRLNLQLPATL